MQQHPDQAKLVREGGREGGEVEVGREGLFTGQTLRQKTRCGDGAGALQDSLNFGFRLGFVSAVAR